ncbi:MAG: primosomal protein N' [Acidobacteriota bacterium]
MTERPSEPPFLEVAVPLRVYRTFTYSTPPAMRARVRAGARVLVPFRNRLLTGIVLELHDRAPQAEPKAVTRLLDEGPLLSSHLLQLGLWLASYYLAPPGEALRVMLPPGLLSRKTAPTRDPKTRLWPTRRRLAILKIRESAFRLSPTQQRVLDQLRTRSLPVLVREFIQQSGCSPSVLQALRSKGALQVEPVEVLRSPWSDTEPGPNPVRKHSLTKGQARILTRIEARLKEGTFHRMLVHGITASGKTEIYLNSIASVLRAGRSALVLVPEIGLTPQISRSFRAWFQDQVAILHSGLSSGQRFDQWRLIREGKARVVVGTRSAVFAPLPDLGIIIVDEEHDGSYKQEEMPRYHGRDTALKRGQIEKALVVLGSATPQLEIFHQSVEKSRFEYEPLLERIERRPLPTVHIVDMRTEFQKRGKAAVLSELLRSSIRDRLDRKQQVLILLNRRGYSSALLCRSCGKTETCRNCSICLTYHQEFNRLLCHYCGYSRPVPEKCRECGKEYIFFVGEGTEKIQETLKLIFSDAVVERFDRDIVQRKGSLQRILRAFSGRQVDVLIGTQMIAKGHDFPGVTLVGVLSADQGLRVADFRSAERTFQLLTQVAGRAGRGNQPGEVIIQTYYPNHYSVKYACAQDYGLFYKKEIEFRRRFRYPPFSALANLVVRGPDRRAVRELAEHLAQRVIHYRRLHSSQRRMRSLGPAAASLERLKGQYRFQILVKTTDRRELHVVLGHLLKELEPSHLKRLSIDIDPINLL